MNYTININQKAMLDSGLKLDLHDMVIIDAIRCFFASGKAKEYSTGGLSYRWISAKKIIEDCPVLNLKKDAVVKRVKVLESKKILERSPDNQIMGMSFFRAGANWDILFRYEATDIDTPLAIHIPSPTDVGSKPLAIHVPTPTDMDTNYHNTNIINTNNQKTKSEEKEDGAKKPAPIPVEKIVEEVVQKADSLEAEVISEKEKICAKKEKAMPEGFDVFAKQYGDFYEAQTGLSLDLKKAANEKGMLAIFSELKKSSKIKYPMAPEAELPARAAKSLQAITANWGSLGPYLKQQIAPSKLAANLPQIIMAIRSGVGTNNGQKQNQPIQLEKPDVAKTAARFNQITI